MILELDSRMRNLNASLTREERALAGNEIKTGTAVPIRSELRTLERLQDIDAERRELLEGQVVEVEARRQRARLRLLKAEQEHETRFRELERSKLMAISARFPDRSETARYILAHLMTEETCLVCENLAPGAAYEYGSRIEDEKCVVCGTNLSTDGTVVSEIVVTNKRVERATDSLAVIGNEMKAAQAEFEAAEQDFDSQLREIQQLNSEIAERSLSIDALIRRLPPDEAEMHQQRSELATMRSRVEGWRSELVNKRQEFSRFVEGISRELVTRAELIKATFNDFGKDFLLETCRLVWAPQKARVGETGDPIQFPAFELEMTGTDFPSPVARAGPDEISESQRHFVDLAFRMTLMVVASNSGIGSLVIDAPESSLDAVFATRAANVLGRFSEPERGNRLVVTSNLIEGNLLPKLIDHAAPSADREGRIVDLLNVAVPTAAVRELRKEYDELRDALINRS